MLAAVLYVTVTTSNANTAGMYLMKAGEICSNGKCVSTSTFITTAVTQVLIFFSVV